MGLLERLTTSLSAAREYTPARLKARGEVRLHELLEQEAVRARARLDELQQRYPSAGPRELAQRFIDQKKQLASLMGGVTGVFGVATVPVDLGGMVWLQLSLLVEIATVFKVSLKSQPAKDELLDLFGYANGIGPVQRSSPRVLGSLATLLLTKGGLKTLGRAVPLVAAPLSAWLNHQHVQRVGEAGIRHYDGWVHARQKTDRA
jgi:hypothetical protein